MFYSNNMSSAPLLPPLVPCSRGKTNDSGPDNGIDSNNWNSNNNHHNNDNGGKNSNNGENQVATPPATSPRIPIAQPPTTVGVLHHGRRT
jgi:hypothetical protein